MSIWLPLLDALPADPYLELNAYHEDDPHRTHFPDGTAKPSLPSLAACRKRFGGDTGSVIAFGRSVSVSLALWAGADPEKTYIEEIHHQNIRYDQLTEAQWQQCERQVEMMNEQLRPWEQGRPRLHIDRAWLIQQQAEAMKRGRPPFLFSEEYDGACTGSDMRLNTNAEKEHRSG